MSDLNTEQSTGPNLAARQDPEAMSETNPAHPGLQAASLHQRTPTHWQTPGCENKLSAKVRQ